MICACCPECRLRCSREVSLYLDGCPACGQPLQLVSSLQEVVGFRLIELNGSPSASPAAAAAAIALPTRDPTGGRP